jgi:hypothetical protein
VLRRVRGGRLDVDARGEAASEVVIHSAGVMHMLNEVQRCEMLVVSALLLCVDGCVHLAAHSACARAGSPSSFICHNHPR